MTVQCVLPSPSKISAHYTADRYVAVSGKQSDWIQTLGFQVMVVLVLFVTMALIIEGARCSWGLYSQSRATKNRDGSPLLWGNEKQLRANVEEINSADLAVPAGESFAV